MTHFWRNKIRIYHIYFILAGFDVLILLMSLNLNHSNVNRFESSIEINRKFASLIESSENLTLLAAQTNGPGE